MPPTLILLGRFQDSCGLIERAASELGWRTAIAEGSDQFSRLCEKANTVGAFIDSGACQRSGLSEACSSTAHRRIKSIVCATSANRLEAHELESLGAFDALLLPLRYEEVRQSLGFLAQALRQKAVAVEAA